MIGPIVFATLLLTQQPTAVQAPQTPAKESTQKDKNAAPPTPWFNKEEDTFDLPSDQHLKDDIKGDEDLGKKYVAEVLKVEKVSKNMAYQERVERIGQLIAHIANHTEAVASWGDRRHSVFHYRYTVLQGDDINAFSLPGGYIFVYEGLLKFVESDDELAAVLAHETAHAAFRHVATLIRNDNKQNYWEIPAVIAAILVRSQAAIVPELIAQANRSGWSIQAEKAADYGGFQYIEHTKYNPVAMLTFMERLAKTDRAEEQLIKNTLYQTHPVTRERAEALVEDLRMAGIPIERSKASPSFRVALKNCSDGTVEASFGGKKFYKFAGPDAATRAHDIAERLNHFYDSVPQVFEVSADQSANAIRWKGQTLFAVQPEDADAQGVTTDKLLRTTLASIKDTIFGLQNKIWLGT